LGTLIDVSSIAPCFNINCLSLIVGNQKQCYKIVIFR